MRKAERRTQLQGFGVFTQHPVGDKWVFPLVYFVHPLTGIRHPRLNGTLRLSLLDESESASLAHPCSWD